MISFKNTIVQCPNCSVSTVSMKSLDLCNVCGSPLETRNRPGLRDSSSSKIPWEDLEKIGFFNALGQTLHQVLLKPSYFLGNISGQNSCFSAWIYAMVLGSIAMIFDILWQNGPLNFLLSSIGINSETYTVTYLPTLFFTPIILTVNTYCIAWYLHFLLVLTRGNNEKFSTTFVLICYVHSVSLLYCLPMIGKLLSSIWALYLIITGISRIQKISRLRSALTIFSPLFIIFALLIFLILAILSGTIIMGSLFKDFIPLFR